jgi:hypothetical protein
MATVHSVIAVASASFTTPSFICHKISVLGHGVVPDPWSGHCTDYCVVYFYFTLTQPIKIKVNFSGAHDDRM